MARSQFSQWYTEPLWRRIRADQLAKEPLCRYCKERGKLTPANVADHIIPHRGDRKAFFYGQLQSLCDHCHSSIKQREESGKPSRLQRRKQEGDHWSR